MVYMYHPDDRAIDDFLAYIREWIENAKAENNNVYLADLTGLLNKGDQLQLNFEVIFEKGKHLNDNL